MPIDVSFRRHSALYIKAITPGTTELSPRPVALYFGAEGTVAITDDADESTADIPVVKGLTLRVQAKKVTAASAGEVYGLYHVDPH